METSLTPSTREALPWYRAWILALTGPNPPAYEDLVTRSGVTTGKAYLWVFLSAAIGSAVAMGLLVAFGVSGLTNPAVRDLYSNLASSAVLLACWVPIAGVLAILGLMISTGISHILARAFGGTGTFTQLAYAIAAYTAPVALVTAPLAFIPLVNCLTWPLSFYLMFLNIVAIKAVHHLSWGRAFLSSTLFVALVLGILACGLIVILVLMGPAIGGVFSNITGGL